jgi:hypothetical protein
MSQERPDEQFAFAVVQRVLDADVRLHDTNGRQGAVDGIVTYPDGRVAALEISSVGPEDEVRITNVLSRSQSRRQLAGISHHWYVQVPGDFHPAELHSIDQAVLRCEELGFDHLSDAVGRGHTDLDALALRHVSADAIHTTSAPEQATRRVYVYRRPTEHARTVAEEQDAGNVRYPRPATCRPGAGAGIGPPGPWLSLCLIRSRAGPSATGRPDIIRRGQTC